MQISTVYFLTAVMAVLPGALAGMCKPPPSPVYTPEPEPVSTPPVYSSPPPVYSSSAAPVSTPPVTTPPAYICDGHLKCCTMPLQGDVGAYCTEGDMPGMLSSVPSSCFLLLLFFVFPKANTEFRDSTATGCTSAQYTICCSEDAEKNKALTPRGYTYKGCVDPTVKTYGRM